jgi:hypothetical protein
MEPIWKVASRCVHFGVQPYTRHPSSTEVNKLNASVFELTA